MVVQYIFDFVIVALVIVGLTATMGVLSNGLGEKVFGGKKHSESFLQSANSQVGWKQIGGKK